MEMNSSTEAIEVETLERRALLVDDFDQGIEAIRRLKTIDKPRAISVALRILNQGVGDVFYQAAAFRQLYEISIAEAINYILLNASTTGPYVLGSMLTSVAVDAGNPENQVHVKNAVKALRNALESRSIVDLKEIQSEREFFDETFN